MGYKRGTKHISKLVGDCGGVMYVPRPKRQRESGHVKDVWCPVCNKKHGFKEIREFDFMVNLDGETIV